MDALWDTVGTSMIWQGFKRYRKLDHIAVLPNRRLHLQSATVSSLIKLAVMSVPVVEHVSSWP